ncbi:MAG: hypothetical protein GY943_20110 [Chloroflexi bacterium]|nr:hypothetical protein [Chloroflexota bacterium]
MTSDTQPNSAQFVIDLIQKSHNRGEIRDLFFKLSVDYEQVPDGSTKRDFIEFLILHIARRDEQKILIELLKKKRSHLNWPDDYTIQFPDSKIAKLKWAPHVGQYIENQEINITFNQSKQRKQTLQQQKSKHLSKDDRLAKIEQDLYEKFFFRTKSIIGGVLGFSAVWGGFALFSIFRDIKNWENNFLIFLMIYALIIVIVYRGLFLYTFNGIDKYTDFYTLRPTERNQVKGILQHRDWGNLFWNLSCKSLISILLIPNKTQANKLQRQSKKF